MCAVFACRFMTVVFRIMWLPGFLAMFWNLSFMKRVQLFIAAKLACLSLDMTCLTHEKCYFLTGYKQCLESLGFRTNPLQQPRVSEAWDRPDVRCFFLSTLLSFYRKIILLISDLNLSLNCCFKLCCILMFLLSLLSFIFSFLGCIWTSVLCALMISQYLWHHRYMEISVMLTTFYVLLYKSSMSTLTSAVVLLKFYYKSLN